MSLKIKRSCTSDRRKFGGSEVTYEEAADFSYNGMVVIIGKPPLYGDDDLC